MAEYNHVQSSSSTTWTISHNLDVSSVAVDAMIDISGNLEKILPAGIEHVDNNTLEITFSSAQTGRARIVG